MDLSPTGVAVLSLDGRFLLVNRALCELFETLSPSAALALDRRLAVGKRDDLLAAKFRGLVVERRDRLRAVLGRVRRTR